MKLKTLIFVVLTFIIPNLYASSLTLPTLNVHTEKKHAKHIKTTGQSVSFGPAAISNQGSQTLSNFLSKQSIIQIKSSSGDQSDNSISIHGFGNNANRNTLLMLDGIPLTSFTNVGPNLNSLMVHNIQSVTILPGSYGTLYGNQAVGGVVQLKSHVPNQKEIYAGISAGNLNQRGANFFYSQRFPSHVGVSIGGLINHTNHYLKNNDENNFNGNAKIDYISHNNHISFNLLSYKTYIQLPAEKIWPNWNDYDTSDDHSTTLGNLFYVTNKHFFNSNWQWNSDVLTSNVKSHGNRFNFRSTEKTLTLQNHFNYRHILTFGTDFQNDRYRSASIPKNNRASANMIDFFSQWTIPINSRLNFIFGGRIAKQWVDAQASNASTNTGTQSYQHQALVDTQGLIFHTSPNLKIYIRRDTNYRFPNAKELVWTNSLVGVQNLKTQKGTSYETGFDWHQHKDSVSLGFYLLDLKNELAYTPNPRPFGEAKNLDPTRRIGLDLANQIQLTQHYTLNTQINLVKATFRSGQYKGKEIPTVPSTNLGAGITYQSSNNWSLNATENYNSATYAANDFDNKGSRMPGYFLTNVNFRKNWQSLSFDLNVDNLFNKHYVTYANYAKSSGLIGYYPDEGISILATLEWHLGGAHA